MVPHEEGAKGRGRLEAPSGLFGGAHESRRRRPLCRLAVLLGVALCPRASGIARADVPTIGDMTAM